MAKKPETLFVEKIFKLRPERAWWYNIPTQAGKAGISLPFDCICLLDHQMFALEFKYEAGYLGAKPHQLANLADINRAGGIGLLVDGDRSRNVRIWRPAILPSTVWLTTTIDDFWGFLKQTF